MRWIIELHRLLSGGWITLRYIYRCTVDTEFFTRKIGEAKSCCPAVPGAGRHRQQARAQGAPRGTDWTWEPVPGKEKAA